MFDISLKFYFERDVHKSEKMIEVNKGKHKPTDALQNKTHRGVIIKAEGITVSKTASMICNFFFKCSQDRIAPDNNHHETRVHMESHLYQ